MFFDNATPAQTVIPPNPLLESDLPLEVMALDVDTSVLTYTDTDLPIHKLRRLCTLFAELMKSHYEVRCTNNPANPNEYLVIRTRGPKRINRDAYTYATMEIGEFYRASKELDPIEQNLRVHTSHMGKKLGRKFSVSYFEPDNVFLIQRTA